jgi:hypothetical protein
MQDAIVFSTWDWKTFNVPERISLALASRGARVLYCEMPVSWLRGSRAPFQEVAERVYRFGPVHLSGKFKTVPLVGISQWKMVAKQILGRAIALKLKDPLFLYSHADRLRPLCQEMRRAGLPLIHVCMDYPETYQYELVELSDLTVVIPKSVFRELRSKYGSKIYWIPQSIHLNGIHCKVNSSGPEPEELRSIPRPRLGYLGPIFARLDLEILRKLLSRNPDWHFVYFGKSNELCLPNAHGMVWQSHEDLPRFVRAFDVGLMLYDRSNKKNLYCSPLKLYDYFLTGLPVVSTPIPELTEFEDLVYFGETEKSLTEALVRALQEPADSLKRAQRMEAARSHSTEALGQRLEEVFHSIEGVKGKSQ